MNRASGWAAAIMSASTHQSAKALRARLVLGLVAHAGPHVGGDQVGTLAGFLRVA